MVAEQEEKLSEIVVDIIPNCVGKKNPRDPLLMMSQAKILLIPNLLKQYGLLHCL